MSIKKRVLSVLLAAFLLLSMVPTAFAAQSSADVTVSVEVVNRSGHKTLQPGDELELNMYAQGVGQYFLGGIFYVSLDTSVVEYTGHKTGPYWKSKTYTLNDETFKYLDVQASPSMEEDGTTVKGDSVSLKIEPADASIAPDGNPVLQPKDYEPVTMPAEKTLLMTVTVKVKDTLPKIEGDVTFGVQVDTLLVGHCNSPEDKPCVKDDKARDVAATVKRVDGKAKIDGVGPTVSITEGQKFYYQPVEFTVSDPSDVASVKLGDAVLTAQGGKYSATKGGRITATDTIGNQTVVNFTIDSTLFDAAKAAAAEVPEADALQYNQKNLVEAAETALAKVTDSAAKAKLAAETARVAAARTKLDQLTAAKTAAEAEIANIPDPFTATSANIKLMKGIKDKIDTLLAAGVKTSEIAGYAKYDKALKSVETALAEIAAAQEKIAAMPAAGAVTFADEKAIADAEKAVQDVRTKYGADILSATEAKPVTDARAALEALKTKKTELVQKIANAQLTVSLRDADQKAISDLRAEVAAMVADKKASFTAAELKNLTDAEAALKTLKEQSKKLHDDVAKLPDAASVKYTQKDAIAKLKSDVAAMEAKGDTFTAEEKKKLADAEKGIAALESAMEALVEKMADLPKKETAVYSDKAVVKEIEAEIARLKQAEYAVDTATAAYKNFAALQTVVKAMQDELEEQNTAMREALKDWSFTGSQKVYDDIRKEMDALAEKYEIPENQLKEAFPLYSTSMDNMKEANDVLTAIRAGVKKLPKEITLKEEAAVNELVALVERLKTDFKMDDAALTRLLGDDYKKVQEAKKIVDRLRAEQDAAATTPPAAVQPSKKSPPTSPDYLLGVSFLSVAFAAAGACLSGNKKKGSR